MPGIFDYDMIDQSYEKRSTISIDAGEFQMVASISVLVTFILADYVQNTYFYTMILIADSGSTKTSWALLSNSRTWRFNTKGVNPSVHDPETIRQVITQELLPNINQGTGHINHIAFFGAGCNRAGCDVMKTVFKNSFSCSIRCASDLDGSAIATIGKKNGIVSILGTGSNSGFYQNGVLTEHVPSLGYILGDEGSGTYLGKQILSDYFKQQMPEELASSFASEFKPAEPEVIKSVYRSSQPNRYLASYVSFIAENKANTYCRNLVEKAFTNFFDRNICVYTDYKNQNLSFTGSIAYGFKDLLTETAKSFNCEISCILQNPIEGLITYYKQQL